MARLIEQPLYPQGGHRGEAADRNAVVHAGERMSVLTLSSLLMFRDYQSCRS
jgi:hypothetical protein